MGFEPLGSRGTKEAPEESDAASESSRPQDSDDFDMFESFAEAQAAEREEETTEGARLAALAEDDWPRLTAEALAERGASGAVSSCSAWVSTLCGSAASFSRVPVCRITSVVTLSTTRCPGCLPRYRRRRIVPSASGGAKVCGPRACSGAGSFLDVGPLVIGPAEAERSIVEVAKVKLSLRPIASLLQFKIVVAAHLEGVQATLRQGENGSWLGYPEDTTPLSARPTISIPVRSGPGGSVAADDTGGGAKLALESVRVVNGTASLHLAGDPDPRLLKRLNGALTISPRGRLELDIQGNPVSRGVSPEERPVTMKSDTLPRHLRPHRTEAEKRSLARELARGNDGGHIRCFLSLQPANNSGVGNGKAKASTIRDAGLADLKVRVQLNNMSASVVERTIPGLPIDIRTGRADGELRLRCNSKQSWKFPDFGGQIRCRGLSFHFFDGPDDFADTDVDLVFEGKRMYLHGGKGFYGAVPIAASGDMDLSPGEKNVSALKEARDRGDVPRPTVVQPGSGRSGEYRISAQVSGVDVHDLRETLGVKPPPRPMAGAIRGFLYVGGPLEYPIFTGSAETIPPKPEHLSRGIPGTEAALAEDAVRAGAAEGATAAYDCLAVKDARAVFTVDTWSQKLTLHEAEASPVAGGEARASGTVRIDAGALSHPEAVNVELEAEGFNPRSVVASLALKESATTANRASLEVASTSSAPATGAEEGAEEADTNGGFLGSLPTGLQQLLSKSSAPEATSRETTPEDGDAGSSAAARASATFGLPQAVYEKIVPATPGTAKATIAGPHAAPVVDAQWEVKDAGMAGDLKITRGGISANVRAPAMELSGSAETSYPPLEVALAARTIDDALAAGRPAFTNASADATLRSLDLAALVVAEDDLARLAPPDRLRLRLSGRVKVNGKVEGAGGTTAESLPKVTAASAETARLAMQQFAANGIETSGKTPYVPSVDGEYDPRFSGEISLDGLRVNQLLLAPRLAGEVRASVEGVGMNARGRADEHFRFELENPASVPADGVAAEPAAEPPAPSVSMSIRRGLLNAAMEASDGRGDVRVAGLRLDDLELASLRGRVERAKLSVDLREKLGAATLRVQQPRLSGMQGEVLDADASWDGRVVRLERAALDQRRSKYTLQGDYCLDDAVWASLPPKRPEPPAPEPEAEEEAAAEETSVENADASIAEDDRAIKSHPLSEAESDASESLVEDIVASEEPASPVASVEIPLYPKYAADEVNVVKRLKKLFATTFNKAKEASPPAEAAADEASAPSSAEEAAIPSDDSPESAEQTADATAPEERFATRGEEYAGGVDAEAEASGADGFGAEEDLEEEDADASFSSGASEEPAAAAGPEWVAELTKEDDDGYEENVFAVSSGQKTSSNPLAGVMDRLAALKLKVMNEVNSGDDIVVQSPEVAAKASEVETSPASEEPALPAVEMDPGAWRLLLAVPQADVEEMLPAVRLAAALREGATPLEYTRAKDHFLEAVRGVALKASEELGRQLDDAAAAAAEQRAARARIAGKGAGSAREEDGDVPVKLPGLQDLRGAWRGTVEVKGGGAATPFPGTVSNPNANQVTAVDFDVAGEDWSWGAYRVQSLEAQGNVSAVEGLRLRRLELNSDGAVVKIDGNLFGDAQNAAFAVIDLPAQRLAPIIHHIASAASASAGAPPPPPPPLPAIAGTLFVSGDIGGSISSPTGSVRAHLGDGRVGSVKMGRANAFAEITPTRTARFHAEANPAASAKRGAPAQPDPGHLRLSGVLPLPDAEDQSLAVDWSVLDGGMQLVSALSAPSLGTGGPVEWQEGGADITLAVRGTLADPIYDGAAVITRAKIVSPLLARPLYPVSANVRIQRNTLYADTIEAKCGPRGSIKVRGAVPVLHTRRGASGETWEGLVARADVQGGIRAEASGLDVRARAAYSGRLDADLVVKGTLLEPEVGGSLRLSKGTAFLQPNAAPAGSGSAAGGGAANASGGRRGGEALRRGSARARRIFAALVELPPRDSRGGEEERRGVFLARAAPASVQPPSPRRRPRAQRGVPFRVEFRRQRRGGGERRGGSAAHPPVGRHQLRARRHQPRRHAGPPQPRAPEPRGVRPGARPGPHAGRLPRRRRPAGARPGQGERLDEQPRDHVRDVSRGARVGAIGHRGRHRGGQGRGRGRTRRGCDDGASQ